MSKIIKLYECTAWCKKRGIEPQHHQLSIGNISLMACLNGHQFLLRINDNKNQCFRLYCLYSDIENFG
jgi:hypothetical protein